MINFNKTITKIKIKLKKHKRIKKNRIISLCVCVQLVRWRAQGVSPAGAVAGGLVDGGSVVGDGG